MHIPNLYHLKYFVDAAEMGSITASAQRNTVSHAAVSRAIKSLEELFGVTLLEHKKRSFVLSPKGQLIQHRARYLLDSAHIFSNELKQRSEIVSGRVRLAISRTLGEIYVGNLMRFLQQEFPAIQLQITLAGTHDAINKLASGQVDLALSIGLDKMASLNHARLHQGRFRLIAPAKFKAKSIKADMPKDFLLTEPRTETEVLRAQFYKKFQTHLVCQHQIESWDMIYRLVSEGHGIGLVPDILIALPTRNRPTILPADWFDCPYEIVLSSRKNQSTSLATQKVFEYLKGIQIKNHKNV